MNANPSTVLPCTLNRWIFLLYFLLLFNVGCKDCGEDVYLGQATLIEQSVLNFPYLNKEKVFFTNAINDTIAYDIRGFKEVRTANQPLNILCEHRSENAVSFIEGESLGGNLLLDREATVGKIQEFQVHLELSNLNTSEPMDTLLIDETRIRSIIRGEYIVPGLQAPFSRINVITNERGNAIANFTGNRREVFNSSIQLNGQTFSDAYASNETRKLICYNQQYGIIAFEDEHALWVFSHME
ncbi:MAG: hypothetical protein AAF985_18930 [Bacteroidota bacterium]